LSRIYEHKTQNADDQTAGAIGESCSQILAWARGSKNRVWPAKRFIGLLFLGIIVGPFSALASANVTLSWNQSSDPIVAGYDIYYGGASGVYTNVIDAGNNTSVTISNLINGATYYFAAATYTAAGAASAQSSEVAYTVPQSTPTLNPIGNQIINATAGAQTVSLAGISTGSAGGNQVLTVTATSSNTNLVSNPIVNYTGGNSAGSLTFSPVAGASGSASITVTVNNGGAGNNLISRSFVVSVGLVTEQLRRAPGGQMVLTLTGPVGSNYVIETSTDLVRWTPFSTNTIPPVGSVEIVDLNPNSPQKFYRAAPYVVLSVPTTPQVSNLKMLFNSKMGIAGYTFTLSGLPGTYVIQSSTDLLNWTSISTNIIPTGGSVQITDSTPTSVQKFYRAVPNAPNGPNAAVVPQSLKLSGFQLGNGVFSFVLNGPAGSNYVIQASTDLVHWAPFSTNTISPDGSVMIVDLNPASPQKFYRAASFNNVVFQPLPQLTGWLTTGAGFSFVLTGQAAHTYDIQATQDFMTWAVIGSVTTDAGGSAGFTDTNAASFSRRFYRIRETQP
jgi:hypothetical protein